jgi:hypothetical protein
VRIFGSSPRIKGQLAAGLLSFAVGVAGAATIVKSPDARVAAPADVKQQADLTPDGKGGGIAPGADASNGAALLTNGIRYHGGPLILGTTNVYYIWYGNWSGNTAVNILPDLASHIGGSPYFNINTTYHDGSGAHVSNSVHFAGSTNDAYSLGTALDDNGVQAVVADAITHGSLPVDKNGVYFVLTSADVNETSGFCSKYCGWHGSATIAGTDIKFSFIGNADRCLQSCAPQTVSPNNNPGADAMASIIAHELEESITDPDGNAWYDLRGQENADKCAWTFGTEYAYPNGSHVNMKLGSRYYLIQRNWVNASGGYCAVRF